MHTPIVIKIGTAVLTDKSGQLNTALINSFIEDIAFLLSKKQKVCIVSSGAIGAGLLTLGKSRQPKKLKKRQALAAIGQVRLMNLYQETFEKLGHHIGQVLLSHEDFGHRRSFLSTRATLEQLLELGVVPIINENDTVSTEEIQFGDNDRLAVLLANLIGASKVIILSATPGLLDMNHKGKLVPVVNGVDRNILSMAREGNDLGSGGMISKLLAIKALVNSGKSTWLADGREPEILRRWFRKEPVGTHFLPQKSKKSSKDLWMELNLKPKGSIEVDFGAADALKKRAASLLSVGITSCKGHFGEDELISITHKNEEFARGVSRFSSQNLIAIIGKDKQGCIETLGPNTPNHVIHSSNLVILEPEL
jgi:glutamate 5-kinase